jgi:hypothetical protein
MIQRVNRAKPSRGLLSRSGMIESHRPERIITRRDCGNGGGGGGGGGGGESGGEGEREGGGMEVEKGGGLERFARYLRRPRALLANCTREHGERECSP